MNKTTIIVKGKQTDERESLNARLKQTFSYDESEEAFLEPEGWEKEYEESTIRVMKLMLLEVIRTKADPQWYRARWRSGLFDSVMTNITICDVSIPMLIPLDGEAEAPFVLTGKRQPECRPFSQYFHPLDMRLAEATQFEWGMKGYVAWREKLSGTPIFKQNHEMICCWFTMPVGQVEAAELTSTGLHILYPYLQMDVEFGGLIYQHNPWRSPHLLNEQDVKEGIILMSHKGVEVRLKRQPTTELRDFESGCTGVWEYAQNEDGSLSPVRERTGAPGYSTFFYHAARFGDIVFPKKPRYEICYNTEGELSFPTLVGSKVMLESGYREKSTAIVRRFGDVAVYTSNNRQILIPAAEDIPDFSMFLLPGQVITGSKAAVYDGRSIFVFKDKEKSWDLIGGNVEVGETSEQALRREIKEELGVSYDGKVDYLGISAEENYYTFVYLVDSSVMMHKPESWTQWKPGLKGVPWLLRLIRHIAATVFFFPDKTVCPYDTGRTAHTVQYTQKGEIRRQEIEQVLCRNGIFQVVAGGLALQNLWYQVLWRRAAWHIVECFRAIMSQKDSSLSSYVEAVRDHYKDKGYVPISSEDALACLRFMGGYVTGVDYLFDFFSLLVDPKTKSKKSQCKKIRIQALKNPAPFA